MIPEQKLMAIYGGGIAFVLIAGWIFLDVQADAIAEKAGIAQDLRKKYSDYYPNTGIPVIEATKQWAAVDKAQAVALSEAESVLMPHPPKSYLDLELSNAQRQQKDDISHIRQRAETMGMKLPSTLPMDGVLDEREAIEGIQLMQLFLFRKVMDACMDDGVSKFSGMRLLPLLCDPTEKYALFQLEVQMESGFEKTDGLLLDMVQRQGHEGFGIRALKVGYDGSVTLKLDATFSMLIPNNKAWNLKFTNNGAPSATSTQDSGKNRFNSK